MKKKSKKFDPSNGSRKDWQNDIEDEITTLLEDIDTLELPAEMVKELEKYIDRFKVRVNERIEQFTITTGMVEAQEDLFSDILYECGMDRFSFSEYDIEQMIEIVQDNKGGTFVKASSIPEQIRLEEFMNSLISDPYQLRLIA